MTEGEVSGSARWLPRRVVPSSSSRPHHHPRLKANPPPVSKPSTSPTSTNTQPTYPHPTTYSQSHSPSLSTTFSPPFLSLPSHPRSSSSRWARRVEPRGGANPSASLPFFPPLHLSGGFGWASRPSLAQLQHRGMTVCPPFLPPSRHNNLRLLLVHPSGFPSSMSTR